jgi:hypothetical protein|tara:strand:- start:453 stop:836 length:384 start_codon:yes stop_codon:yes gene_type:complete
MKKIISILFIIASLNINAQDGIRGVFIKDNIVKFEKVSKNLYKSIVEKDNELQIGTYKLIDKKYIAHGNWRLYKNNKQVQKAQFENGIIVELTTWTDQGKIVLNQEDIQIRRLQNKIRRLEKAISSI